MGSSHHVIARSPILRCSMIRAGRRSRRSWLLLSELPICVLERHRDSEMDTTIFDLWGRCSRHAITDAEAVMGVAEGEGSTNLLFLRKIGFGAALLVAVWCGRGRLWSWYLQFSRRATCAKILSLQLASMGRSLDGALLCLMRPR